MHFLSLLSTQSFYAYSFMISVLLNDVQLKDKNIPPLLWLIRRSMLVVKMLAALPLPAEIGPGTMQSSSSSPMVHD